MLTTQPGACLGGGNGNGLMASGGDVLSYRDLDAEQEGRATVVQIPRLGSAQEFIKL